MFRLQTQLLRPLAGSLLLLWSCEGKGLLSVPDKEPSPSAIEKPAAPAPDLEVTVGGGYVCTPPALAEVNLDAIAGVFENTLHPRMMSPTTGCVGCHGATSARLFKVSPNARETFDSAFVAGLFGQGQGTLLSRLSESDPLFRMPLGQPAWSSADLQQVAELTCRVAYLSQRTVCAASEIHPGSAPLRRLNRREFGNTLIALLGITDRPGAELLPEDLHVEGWPDNDADLLSVGSAHVRGFAAVAEDVSLRITSDLPAFLKCASPTDACASTFLLDDFGRRAFRRPLSAAEKTRYSTLFTEARASWTLREAVMVTVQAFLQAPPFLYRIEAPPAAPNSKPSSYEMASRLSYLYLQAPPDETLLTLAANDALQDPAAISAQATRLLSDPRAKTVVLNFHRQWLSFEDIQNVTKDAAAFPAWSDTLRPHMLRETELFLEDVFWNPTSEVSELLTAPYSFMNKPLADFYGVSGPSGTGFVKVTLPPTRTGLLSHASILATQALEDQTHPVYRGNFVLTRLLGQVLGAPPPTDASGNPIDLPPMDLTKTTRERFAAHSDSTLCAGCHRKIDPIGFALESFDGTGRWQTTQAGKTLDPSGVLIAPAGVEGPVSGARELMTRVGQSPELQRTLIQRWFSLSTGRSPGVEDACNLERLEQAFNGSGRNLRTLFALLSTSDAFLYRGTAP
jgi:hypothetical protein